MKRLWISCMALLSAMLALVPGLASAQPMVRQYNIDWQTVSFKSQGSCLDAMLQYEGSPMFHVNAMPLPTYTVANSFFTRPNGDQQNLFRAPFSGSLLRWGMNDIFFGVSTSGNGDYCTFSDETVVLKSQGLNPRLLFHVVRSGKAFEGVAPISLHLREINPTLSESLLALEQAVNNELSIVYYLGQDLAAQRARAAQLQALLDEMTALCQRPLDSITQAELDAILSKYSDVSPQVRARLEQLLVDLKKSVEELRAEIDRIVAEFRGQMQVVDDWSVPPPPTGDVDLGNPGTYEPDLDDDQVADVQVPDVSTSDPWDPTKDPYKAFADQILVELNKSVVDEQVVDRQGFMAAVRLWRFNQNVFESGLKSRIGVSQEEWGAFLTAQQQVLTRVRQFMDSEDWFLDCPVYQSTKNFVAYLSQRSGYEARANALKNSLNTWYGGQTPTLQQKLALDTLDGLFTGFQYVDEGGQGDDAETLLTILGRLTEGVDGAVTITKEIGLLVVGFSPAGDFLDFCEAFTGREGCLPGGEQLTTGQRLFTAAGLIIGSGGFWRRIGDHLIEFRHVSETLGRVLDNMRDVSKQDRESILLRLADCVLPGIQAMSGPQAPCSSALEHLDKLTGQELLRTLDRVGDARTKRFAAILKSDGVKELMEFRFSKFFAPVSDIVKNMGAKVKALPPLKGKTKGEVEDVLRSRGFGSSKTLPDGTVMWTSEPIHEFKSDGSWYQDIWMDQTDGSVVRVAGATGSRPYLHLKKEISDTAQDYSTARIKAKVTDHRASAPEFPDPTKPDQYSFAELTHPGTSFVEDQFAQMLAKKTGKTAAEVKATMRSELEDLMNYWADETHLALLP